VRQVTEEMISNKAILTLAWRITVILMPSLYSLEEREREINNGVEIIVDKYANL